ncbi:class E sortase [Candidatus Saccharibacteria bacterium]|jgi:sortase A|nr:class E sortase [Candidatus Saccharibacteria bacterium]
MNKHKQVYKDGQKSKTTKTSRLRLILALFLLGLGLYQLLLVISPKLNFIDRTDNIKAEIKKENGEDSIIIPKIGVNIAYKSGDANVLDDYAWHRYPERGDPVKGGNFIISAHRFKVGYSPGETRRRSPFYNIEQLQAGDKIYTRFNKKMYEYTITKRYQVKPTDVEIEGPSKKPKLTVYSCTLKGSADGRIVIEAEPVGETKDTPQPDTAAAI